MDVPLCRGLKSASAFIEFQALVVIDVTSHSRTAHFRTEESRQLRESGSLAFVFNSHRQPSSPVSLRDARTSNPVNLRLARAGAISGRFDLRRQPIAAPGVPHARRNPLTRGFAQRDRRRLDVACYIHHDFVKARQRSRVLHLITRIARGESLADQAYRQLRDAILSHELPPGTRLSVPELARNLEISRSPVREAVQRLIHEGLASHRAKGGAEVATADAADLEQLYMVRELLEGLAARLAATRLNLRQREELENLVEEQERLVGDDRNRAAHADLDMRLHRAVRDIAGNSYLRQILDGVQGKAHLALHTLWYVGDGPLVALREHRQIVEAILSGEPDLAEQAARQHVARLRAGLGQLRPKRDRDKEVSPRRAEPRRHNGDSPVRTNGPRSTRKVSTLSEKVSRRSPGDDAT